MTPPHAFDPRRNLSVRFVTPRNFLPGTHSPELVLTILLAISPRLCRIGTYDTVDGFDVNDSRSAQLTRILQSHIIFAHNLHLAFLRRRLMTFPATDVPIFTPSVEDEEN